MEQASASDQLREIWDEEAAKLGAGDESLALETKTLAPDEPPQEAIEPQPKTESEPAASLVEEDPFAGLPSAVRAKLEQIDQLAKSNAQLLQHVKTAEGRVAAVQRELQVAKMAQQSVAPSQAPTQTQIAAAAKSPQKWEQLRSDFPEWSEAIEEFVATKIGSVQQQPGLAPEKVQEMVQQQVEQARSEMARTIEEVRVDAKYENWRDTINTPEFMQWFVIQTPELKALADSTASRDAIRLLDLYHQARSKPASEIRQERGARLAAAATTRPGQTPPPRTLDDMSPTELWQYEAAQREKERARRGY